MRIFIKKMANCFKKGKRATSFFFFMMRELEQINSGDCVMLISRERYRKQTNLRVAGE